MRVHGPTRANNDGRGQVQRAERALGESGAEGSTRRGTGVLALWRRMRWRRDWAHAAKSPEVPLAVMRRRPARRGSRGREDVLVPDV